MRKALPWLFFLSLAGESDELYMGRMWTPMKLMGWFTETLPVKLSPFEILCFVMLFASGAKGKARRATPMIRAIHGSLATAALWWVYGVATGGEVKPTYTQLHLWVFGMVFALTVSRLALTREDFHRLGKALFHAAIYRALMAILFYALFVGDLPSAPPVMTTHADSALFCVGLLLATSHAIEVRTKAALRALLFAAPVILLAIQVNNRRLAWASLGAGLVVLYALAQKNAGPRRRKLNRVLLVAGPILALYVTLGWERTESVFKPVAAFSSMGGGVRDASTKARDNENIGLVVMVSQRPLLGTGFGLPWYEVDATYTVPVSVFPMYHYMPHNSVLALLAFTGSIGFAGIWMVLPVSVYLNRRTYLRATHPVDRIAAATGVVVVVVVMNQLYGDMGIVCMTPMTILGAALGAASRLSPLSGAWPSNGPRPIEAKGDRG
jgi:O-Antigen ligase